MTIFVRNLPKYWNTTDLCRFLRKRGVTAKRCLMPGKKRGLGLVELVEPQSVEQVIALLNTQTVEAKQLVAMPATHPIVENAAGSFDDKPQPVLPPKRKRRRSKPHKGHRHVVLALKPVREDNSWPPVGVQAFV